MFLEMLRRETAAEPERTVAALKGLRLYQEAPRRPPPPLMPVIAETHGATLRDYGGDGAPVLFVPSLINPPTILDLSEEKSLLRWLATRSHRVLLVDWGTDVAARRALSVAGHVEEILLPLMRTLDGPPALVGYCLGGTMAVAAAALAEVRSLVTIAAPWHFTGYGEASREKLGALWEQARPVAEAIGLLPMEVLQSAFWSLDPARTVAKFERLAEDDRKLAEFVALEDWANDGPPLPHAAARELFEDFFDTDTPGTAQWRVAGRSIHRACIGAPSLDIVSTVDRIVPRESAAAAGAELELAQGHVGMMVGSRASEMLWEPLAAWLGPR